MRPPHQQNWEEGALREPPTQILLEVVLLIILR